MLVLSIQTCCFIIAEQHCCNNVSNNLLASSLLNNIVATMLNNTVDPTMLFTHCSSNNGTMSVLTNCVHAASNTPPRNHKDCNTYHFILNMKTARSCEKQRHHATDMQLYHDHRRLQRHAIDCLIELKTLTLRDSFKDRAAIVIILPQHFLKTLHACTDFNHCAQPF